MGRIGLIHLKGNLDTVPCLMSSITLLRRAGYEVDIFIVPDRCFQLPSIEDTGVRFHSLGERRARGLGSATTLLRWLSTTFGVCHRSHMTALIGVDAEGFVLASLLSVVLRIPVIYYSLEVLVAAELTRLPWRLLKTVERWCSRRAAFAVIQDAQRAALLAAENGIALADIICVPNSSLATAQNKRTDYLQMKLGIPDSKRVVLCAGTLAPWAQSLELARCAHTWTDDWELVLHSRQRLADDEYHQEIRRLADCKHVYLSTEVLPFECLPDLMASADVGVALYRIGETFITGQNLALVGLSSGKLAGYLQVGLPVVISALPGLSELVEAYHCGIAVAGPEEVATALEQLLCDYDRYAAAALRCYEEQFDFASKFQAVLQRLSHLTPSSGRMSAS